MQILMMPNGRWSLDWGALGVPGPFLVLDQDQLDDLVTALDDIYEPRTKKP
jgi:hypothetical protein